MAGSTQQPFEVVNFSRGITDDTFEQVYEASAELDNFVITSDGKLLSRDGSVVDNVDYGQIPAGAARVGALINYDNNENLLVNSGRQIFFRDPDAYSILRGPDNNEVFSTGDAESAISFTQWDKHVFLTNDAWPLPVKIFKDNNGQLQVRNNGFDYLSSDPVLNVDVAGEGTYIYAFHWHYTYMAGDEEIQDFGPVTQVQVENAAAPNVSAIRITGIPTLSNGLEGNYDLANVKCFIYRTVDGGDTFYKVGEVPHGDTQFWDTSADEDISTDGLVLYTDDGTVDYEAPPRAKYVHVVNGTGYYAHTYEDGETFKTTVYQSVPGIPGAVPGDFFTDVEDEIVGLSSTKSIPLVFCRKYVYRLEQGFDRFGRGLIRAVRISDTAGCVSNLALVQAENFCVFFGADGVYATDGYQVSKISDSNNTRYKKLLESQLNPAHICGAFNEKDRRIYWGVQRDASNLTNDSLLVFDMRWGVQPKGTFTTWSGKSFRPTAVTFFDGKLHRGSSRGFVFIHSSEYTTDPLVDILKPANEWYTETIIWTYSSININFGSTFFRKMPTRILLQAANLANTTIQISAISDDGRIVRDLKPIRWRRNFVWGDTEFVWGNPDCVWGGVGLIEQWRRFQAKSLRLSYLQLVITNGNTIVTNSDTDGTATFNGTTNQIVLDDQVNNAWPPDVVGYNIRAEVDGYSREFEVVERVDDFTIEVIDPENLLPTGSYQWELWGFKKGEPLNLLGYNVHWNNVSQSQNTFETGQDGANA